MIKHIYCIIHFMQHNFVFQLTFCPFQDKINKLPLTACNHDTVQIHSGRGSHSVAHSDSDFRYSSDTLQIRMPFWYSFRFNFQIQFRYAPNTDVILILIQIQLSRYTPDKNAILILIQIQLSDTVQICSRYEERRKAKEYRSRWSGYD